MTTHLTGERADLVETLQRHRGFLLQTVQGLTQEQATRRTTVSVLNLAGLIKHVSDTEAMWADFARRGAVAFGVAEFDADVDWTDPEFLASLGDDPRHDEFHLVGDETFEGVLARYAEVAAATDELAATGDLDARHALPVAPWFTPGALYSVRRVLLHVVAETAQHAGHADILREALDGARTMG